MTTAGRARYAGYRFPAEIISHAVWLYFRFPLGLRMIEELLAARGIIVSHETVQQWAPRLASKDQVGDWLDAYATIMDLDIWTGAECVGSQYDETLGAWRLSVVRGGRPVELRPAQLMLATGFWDSPSIPNIPGRDRFAGRQFHVTEARDLDQCEGLQSIVIGAGASAHDISAQLWEAGANVTMIQRSPTIVARIDSLLPAAEIYDTDARAPNRQPNLPIFSLPPFPIASCRYSRLPSSPPSEQRMGSSTGDCVRPASRTTLEKVAAASLRG